MARVYTKIDYSPAWELNEKVIDYIFSAQTNHVMAIGRRKTKRRNAYHSIFSRKYGERRMPIDKQWMQ